LTFFARDMVTNEANQGQESYEYRHPTFTL
jgi:hypothetical protein